MKGAARVIGIDKVPERLKKAQENGIETLDFSKHTDIVKRLQEVAPGGLNVAIDCGGPTSSSFQFHLQYNDCWNRNIPRAEIYAAQSREGTHAGDRRLRDRQ